MSLNTNLSNSVFKFVSHKKVLSEETGEKCIGNICRPKDIYGFFDLAIDNNKTSRNYKESC